MPEEIWKPIIDYEDLYEVSNLGNVRSLVNNGRHKRSVPKLLKPDNARSHARVTLSKNGKTKRFFSSCLVLTAFVGERPQGFQCSHIDGNPGNDFLTNLCWESCQDNNERKFVHGTSQIGECHGRSKLTDALVLEIRELYALGQHSLRKLAIMFNVDRGTITQVVYRRTWTHI